MNDATHTVGGKWSSIEQIRDGTRKGRGGERRNDDRGPRRLHSWSGETRHRPQQPQPQRDGTRASSWTLSLRAERVAPGRSVIQCLATVPRERIRTVLLNRDHYQDSETFSTFEIRCREMTFAKVSRLVQSRFIMAILANPSSKKFILSSEAILPKVLRGL